MVVTQNYTDMEPTYNMIQAQVFEWKSNTPTLIEIIDVDSVDEGIAVADQQDVKYSVVVIGSEDGVWKKLYES